MRVHYDDQIVMHQRHGGVSRYFVELVSEFRRDRGLGVTVDLDWRRSRNEHVIAAGLGRPASRWRRRLGRLGRRLTSGSKPAPDIVHPTWYYPDRLPRASGPPMVVTVVDMIPELMPELFARAGQHLGKEEYVRRAAAIVCISESTRHDLLQVYGHVDADVAVVHLGVRGAFRPGLPRPPGLPDSYLLFIGNRRGYKDFAVALEAFREIRPRFPDVDLVVVGGGPFSDDEESMLGRSSLREAVHRIDASDAELPGLLGNARAFVFPSRYEGFGLPTLEAMACGTPVILADSSSHPEVGGDVALYFAPGDAAALAAQLSRVLDDESLANGLSERGVDRAAAFTWRRTAALTRDVYAKVGRPG